MKRQIKLEEFEGPLEILVDLIDEKKIDITGVFLAQVCDQYIEQLKKLPEMPIDEAANFLLVATKLLWVKSKALLPYLTREEEDGINELENQLKIYKQFAEASKKMESILSQNEFSFSRIMLLKTTTGFNPPKKLTVEKIKVVFNEILKNREVKTKLPKDKIIKIISLAEKIQHIKNIFFNKSEFDFGLLLSGIKEKTEIIVTFLAILELARQKVLIVEQQTIFSEIQILKK